MRRSFVSKICTTWLLLYLGLTYAGPTGVRSGKDGSVDSARPPSSLFARQYTSTSLSSITVPTSTTQSLASSTSTSTLLCDQTACSACLDNAAPPQPTATCSGCLSGTGVPLLPQATTSLSTGLSTQTTGVSTQTSAVAKRTLPLPENFDTPADFILDGLFWALGENHIVQHRPPNTGGASSAIMVQLADSPLNIGVRGLYGCTSVVVASQQGVWISHFWESPSFQTQAAFQKDVLDTICAGDGTNFMPGLSQYTVQFAAVQNPQIVIVTPRDRLSPTTAGALQYPDMINQLKTALVNCIPSTDPPTVVDYVPTNPLDPEFNNLQANTVKGKVLIQYDPAEKVWPVSTVNGCRIQNAVYRIWVEDAVKPETDSWIAESNQLVGASSNQKRGNDSCSLPAIDQSTGSTTNPTAPASLPCYNFADPDQGGTDFCTCTNGASLPPAASTGSNTGAAYQPCPWTTIPASTATSALPTITPSPQYAITVTQINSDVVECQSASFGNFGGFKETFCAGSSVTISVAPSASVQVGKIQQNVGTLTGSALYTSISSALDKICPTATGETVQCSTDTVSISGIDYIQSDGTLGEGELVVSVQASSYNETKLRDAMIKSAALTAKASANSTNCYVAKHEQCDGRGPCVPKNINLCNAAGFAGVQYYDGQQTGAAMWLDAIWEFGVYSGGAFACDTIIEVLDELLVVVAPEFVVGDTVIGDALLAGCQAVNS